MASFIAFLLLSVTLLPFCYSIRNETVHNAVEILADSGYTVMSFTLPYIDQVLSNTSSATIFSPSDDAFSQSGQPSMSLLELHIAPVVYSFDELHSLPYGSRIPTLSPNRSLIVTTLPSDDHISIDGAKIHESPIYDDGFLIVYGVDDFFDLDYRPALSPSPELAPRRPSPSPNFECPVFDLGARL